MIDKIENNMLNNFQENKEKMIMAVMIFVFDDKRNILLLRRIDNKKWEPVKGGINPGEEWHVAALRELEEEIGITPTLEPKLVSIVDDELDTHEGKKTKIKGHVSYCFVPGLTPIPALEKIEDEMEHDDFRWVSYEEIENEELFPPLANKLIREVKIKLDEDEKNR